MKYFIRTKLNNLKKEFDGTNNKEMKELTDQLFKALSIAMKGKHTFLSFLNLDEKNHTSIFEPNNQKEVYVNGTGAETHGRAPYQFLDTPNTTSQITYKMQVYTDGNQAVTFNNSCYSYIYAMEVAV